MSEEKKRTDEEIKEHARRAAAIAMSAAHDVADGSGKELDITAVGAAAIAATVAQEVARPTVTIDGGTIDKIDGTVNVNGEVSITGMVYTSGS